MSAGVHRNPAPTEGIATMATITAQTLETIATTEAADPAAAAATILQTHPELAEALNRAWHTVGD